MNELPFFFLQMRDNENVLIGVVLVAANEAFERLASLGLMPNMILYLTREYGMQTAGATNFLLLWSAVSNFTPFIGAVLADSYVGRYSMIAFGSVASLLVIFSLISRVAALTQLKIPHWLKIRQFNNIYMYKPFVTDHKIELDLKFTLFCTMWFLYATVMDKP